LEYKFEKRPSTILSPENAQKRVQNESEEEIGPSTEKCQLAQCRSALPQC